MNREIKFRVWDKENKVMLPVASVWYNEDETICSITYRTEGTVETLFRGFELMQYTGLKDKNGTPIHEGDVIKRWNGGYGPIEYREDKFVVVFDDPQKPGYCEGLKSYIYPQEGQVIGNVFENPELLGKEGE